jgi:hypothetical protein
MADFEGGCGVYVERFVAPDAREMVQVAAVGALRAAKRAETSDRSQPVTPVGDAPERLRQDPDDALRKAIVAAVEAGQLDRAAKLLAVLQATAPAASVVDLASRRR